MIISYRDWRKENTLLYQTLLGESPEKIAHWEHFSCPDAETFVTGIDYYEAPRECRLRWNEIYPFAPLAVPDTNAPLPRPRLDGEINSTDPDTLSVRWGDGETGSFEHGEKIFKSAEQVFAFSPLEKLDFRDWGFVHAAHNYASEKTIYQELRKRYPAAWGDQAPEKELAFGGIYNTMFMWPMLTFGWELFLECCLDDRFERIMGEFAVMNRRYFKASAKLPINIFNSHDDIVMTNGPVCSPEWMNKYIFPCYEEQWGYLKEKDIPVTFMVDGCIDAYAENVLACGAMGIISEPYTNYKALAQRHKNIFLAGEGDNRVLSRNNPEEIRAMVESMVETARMSEKYVMCIGNHIPWNVPPTAVKLYFDLCGELAYR